MTQQDADNRRIAINAIGRWRDMVLAKTGWTFGSWARRAGVSSTTLSRNMSPESTTSAKIETLHALAKAAGVPSPLDFLDDQAGTMRPSRGHNHNANDLITTFTILLESVDIDPHKDQLAARLAAAFPVVLEEAGRLRERAKKELHSARAEQD